MMGVRVPGEERESASSVGSLTVSVQLPRVIICTSNACVDVKNPKHQWQPYHYLMMMMMMMMIIFMYIHYALINALGAHMIYMLS